jgi:hypothetical protein
VQKLHNYSDIKGNALKKLSSGVQIFTFAILRDQALPFAPIPSLLTADNCKRLVQNFFALALFEKENKGSPGAGHLVSPTKVKALAVSITKRNPDFLRVEDFGK